MNMYPKNNQIIGIVIIFSIMPYFTSTYIYIWRHALIIYISIVIFTSNILIKKRVIIMILGYLLSQFNTGKLKKYICNGIVH